jgi:hypothetical protein
VDDDLMAIAIIVKVIGAVAGAIAVYCGMTGFSPGSEKLPAAVAFNVDRVADFA